MTMTLLQRLWSNAKSPSRLPLRGRLSVGASLGKRNAAHSADLGSYSLSTGTYTLYVQAVGQPSILNHMSGPVAYSR